MRSARPCRLPATTAMCSQSLAKGTPLALSAQGAVGIQRQCGRAGGQGRRSSRPPALRSRLAPAATPRAAFRRAEPAARSGRRRRESRSRRRGSRRRRPIFPAPRRAAARHRPMRATACPSSPSSRARLIVCGSARSAKIRAAVSATILSLSVTHCRSGFPDDGGRPAAPSCGAAAPLASGCAAPEITGFAHFVELIGATIPGSVAVIKSKKQAADRQ